MRRGSGDGCSHTSGTVVALKHLRADGKRAQREEGVRPKRKSPLPPPHSLISAVTDPISPAEQHSLITSLRGWRAGQRHTNAPETLVSMIYEESNASLRMRPAEQMLLSGRTSTNLSLGGAGAVWAGALGGPLSAGGGIFQI